MSAHRLLSAFKTYTVGFLVVVRLVACSVVEVDDMVVPEGEKCKYSSAESNT